MASNKFVHWTNFSRGLLWRLRLACVEDPLVIKKILTHQSAKSGAVAIVNQLPRATGTAAREPVRLEVAGMKVLLKDEGGRMGCGLESVKC